jgi:hypothetical protein
MINTMTSKQVSLVNAPPPPPIFFSFKVFLTILLFTVGSLTAYAQSGTDGLAYKLIDKGIA